MINEFAYINVTSYMSLPCAPLANIECSHRRLARAKNMWIYEFAYAMMIDHFGAPAVTTIFDF